MKYTAYFCAFYLTFKALGGVNVLQYFIFQKNS